MMHGVECRKGIGCRVQSVGCKVQGTGGRARGGRGPRPPRPGGATYRAQVAGFRLRDELVLFRVGSGCMAQILTPLIVSEFMPIAKKTLAVLQRLKKREDRVRHVEQQQPAKGVGIWGLGLGVWG